MPDFRERMKGVPHFAPGVVITMSGIGLVSNASLPYHGVPESFFDPSLTPRAYEYITTAGSGSRKPPAGLLECVR